jgi:fluoroquinolone transport system permease protein
MTRLLSTMQLDFKVQVRNNLYQISIGLAILLMLGARFAVPREMLGTILPTFFWLGIGGTTYMFLAGMMIFEKNEGTLSGLVVTPLTIRDYITSKAVTLMVIAFVEATIVILLSYGWRFNVLYVYGGLTIIGLMYLFTSLILVVRYDSVTDFLVPSIVIMVTAQLPMLILADLGTIVNSMWYIIPTTAPFLLMKAGFTEIPTWQLVYGIVYSLITLVVLALWAHRAFDRHIIQTGGS